MISYIDDIKTKYTENISAYIPIQRAGIYFLTLYFFAYYFQKCPENIATLQPIDGFWNHLLELDILYFIDPSKGLIPSMKIKYHILTIATVTTTAFLTTYLKKGMYDFYIKIHKDFDTFIDDCKKKSLAAKNNNDVINIELSRDIAPDLQKTERKISKYTSITELFIGIALLSFVNFYFNFKILSINTLIFTTSTTLIIILNFISIKLYFEEFLPIYTLVKSLRGEIP
ncbi:hypothetical protein [Maridesulfovibrio hydrothermalis]|uniref:Uncharacterized protein n=1 Tax=Maridesulfovibrio hydrothermalis AM13 = DSM 14728 TaxID=1121451 RepID=L0R7S7_9BACT|nr:hypothetical protein [Maridesulfovibrio hydrothermalis]CCO22277.1 membrane protein of unknown function [Maridesulfovibrio hydrothermalis AM13 = DSM 14728]